MEITTPEVRAEGGYFRNSPSPRALHGIKTRPHLFFFSFFSCDTWLWLPRLLSLSKQGLLPQGVDEPTCMGVPICEPCDWVF